MSLKRLDWTNQVVSLAMVGELEKRRPNTNHNHTRRIDADVCFCKLQEFCNIYGSDLDSAFGPLKRHRSKEIAECQRYRSCEWYELLYSRRN